MPPAAFQAIGPLATRALMLCLLHGVWIGALVLVIARAIARACLRRAPAHRYALYAISLASTVLVPPVVIAFQSNREQTPAPVRSNKSASIKVVRGDLLAGRPRGSRQSQNPEHTHAPSVELHTARDIGNLVRRAESWLVRAWLVAATLMAARLLFSLWSIRLVRRRSIPAPAALAAQCAALTQRLGLRRAASVALNDRIAEPCLIGVLQPMVLIPSRLARSAPSEWLDAVLAHELAHARRCDVLANLVQRVVEIVMCPNPVVHALSSELRRQRELCADALANRITRNPLALATALAQLASDRSTCRVRRPVMALGAGSSSLLPRIEEMLGMKPKSKRSHWPLACLMAAAAVAATGASSLGWPQEPAPANTPQRVREVIVSEFAPASLQAPKFVVGVENAPIRTQPISYEVRFVDVDSNALRRALVEDFERIETEGELSAWRVVDGDVARVLAFTQSEPQANVLRAPKVSAFENASVSISNTTKTHWVAAVKPVVTKTTARFEPTVKSMDVGVTLALRGRVAPTGIEMKTSIHNKYVVSYQKFGVPASIIDLEGKKQTVTAPVHLPAWREYTEDLTATVKPGESLLVSLGVYEKRPKPTDATELGILVVSALGGPKLEPERQVRERLVLITPRLIAEERGK